MVISNTLQKGIAILISLIFYCQNSLAQKATVADTLKSQSLNEVAVTATRTEKDIADIPTPIKIISGEQIKAMGSMRLNEVLQEQTGLQIVTDHGTGIQMQGFAPDYTMILVDGEPIVGRTAGTLDLTRIAVGNIKRIEIVRGPSSSLYGSEALAGVINIITEKPKDGIMGGLRTRYGSNNTLDLNGNINFKKNKFGITGFANRYYTGGYNLSNTEFATVPPFENYTFTNKITYDLTPKTQLILSSRYFSEFQGGGFSVTDNKVTENVTNKGDLIEYNINPSVIARIGLKTKLRASVYTTSYDTRSLLTYNTDGALYDYSFFKQIFTRPEVQVDRFWAENHTTTFGAGTILESVEATRYDDVKRFRTIYGYLQHDMTLFKKLTAIAGARFDAHNVYGSRLSPKLSAQYKIIPQLTIKASVGQGFKAPDFRQIYLNFSNPVEGYSVFGSEEVKYRLAQLQSEGQIALILIDPSNFKPLKAEFSTSYNIGFSTSPIKPLMINVNFFRNDINDLIQTAAVAMKTNSQSVYSYFNVEKAYTQGFEIDGSLKIMKKITLSAGYQYLEAKDKNVENQIKNGEIYNRDANGNLKQVTLSEYGGLYNRSKHMGNIRVFFEDTKTGIGATIRFIYRGKYGFSDTNGNLILDDPSEYVQGYGLLNASLSKRLWNTATLMVGMDNITNYTNPQYISSIPGRLIYGTLQFIITQDTFKKKVNEI